eukprot:tig00021037_g17459.t1
MQPRARSLALVLLALAALASASDPEGRARPQAEDRHAVNFRPVIGILSQPTGRSAAYHARGKSYIAASYVKWVESAGLRVLPVLYDTPPEELKVLFKSLNGLVIPGGRGDVTHDWHTAARLLLHEAVHANRRGDYFPVWGTCDGFKLLVKIHAAPKRVFTPCDAENITVPLDFEEVARDTYMFRDAPDWLLDALQEDVAANNHRFCVSRKRFRDTPGLSAFRVLTSSVDASGRRFVSTIEARKLPFYATQWHPEKNAFEWGAVAVDHSPQAIRAMQYFAEFLGSEARLSPHAFDPALEPQLIYRFTPFYAQPISPTFMQVYFFGDPVPLERPRPPAPAPHADVYAEADIDGEGEWDEWARDAEARGYGVDLELGAGGLF